MGIVRPDIMDRIMTTVNSIDVVFLKRDIMVYPPLSFWVCLSSSASLLMMRQVSCLRRYSGQQKKPHDRQGIPCLSAAGRPSFTLGSQALRPHFSMCLLNHDREFFSGFDLLLCRLVMPCHVACCWCDLWFCSIGVCTISCSSYTVISAS